MTGFPLTKNSVHLFRSKRNSPHFSIKIKERLSGLRPPRTTSAKHFFLVRKMCQKELGDD